MTPDNMPKLKSFYLFTFVFFTTILLASNFNETSDTNKRIEESSTKQTQNTDNFNTMMEVITHKRCVNCHPSGNTPRQGEDSHLHNFGIVRGETDHGLAGYTCNTCHTEENNDYSGVPGAPHWAVAPKQMAWEGKTKIEIANQMMDPKRNGGKSHEDILKHLTEDKLVLWAWDPGVDAEGIPREKPPVPKEAFITAVSEWIKAGAVIPSE